MKDFLKSFIKSTSEAFAKNEYIIHWRKKYPRLFEFIGRRLSFNKPFGFYFSAGIVLSAVAFIYFLGLTQDILAKDPFVEADIRLMNLVAALRSITVAKVLLVFTYLGNWQFIVSLGVIFAIILWLLKEKRKLTFLVIGVIIGELLYTLFKLILHRTRPDIGFSLISRNGYAFPSGHATMSLIFYGMVSCGFLKILKKQWQKFLLITLFVVLIFLIGFSRIYLGVHWVSDILAGWALGLAFLILIITFFKERERFSPEAKTKGIFPKKVIIIVAVVLLIFEGIFLLYFYCVHPLIEPPLRHSERMIIPLSSNLQSAILSEKFPKFSENLVGGKMEPISFIVIGSKEQLIQIFQKSGWFVADEPHKLLDLYHLAAAAILNQPYSTAPVTPSFLDAQPNVIAFQKPTEANTVRQRHHIRFWLTDYYWGEVPIWVATASFDDGLRYFIAHKIHPDIDTERDFIKNELVTTGLIRETRQIQLVEPFLGKNQTGDQFFTDGKAYILFLR